jgi:hypothetical protein
MERLLSKRKQLAREAAAATEQNAPPTVKREVKRGLTDSADRSRNGDIVVDPVTGHQTVRFFDPIASFVLVFILTRWFR